MYNTVKESVIRLVAKVGMTEAIQSLSSPNLDPSTKKQLEEIYLLSKEGYVSLSHLDYLLTNNSYYRHQFGGIVSLIS